MNEIQLTSHQKLLSPMDRCIDLCLVDTNLTIKQNRTNIFGYVLVGSVITIVAIYVLNYIESNKQKKESLENIY